MKKLSLILACLTLLLSACRTETREPEETDILETSAAIETSLTVSETAMIVSETASETVTETETEPSKPVIVDERESVPEGLTAALDLKGFEDEGYYPGSYAVLGGDVLLVNFICNFNRVDEMKPSYLSGISLTDKKQLFRIDAPSSDCYFELYENITDGESSACAELCKIGGEKISLTELDKDGNYKITEGADKDDIVYSWADRVVKNSNGNIENVLDGSYLCARTGEEIEEDSLNSKIYRFDMPIDENRFVFLKFGYEWVESVGIYDFEAKDITILPDSMHTSFLGIHNSTIYTVDSVDGVGENVYSYDPVTLERKHFCGSPYELQMRDMLYFAMPESGDFIAALYSPWYERDEASRLALLSPETGEIMAEYILPEDFSFYTPFFTKNFIYIIDGEIIYSLPMPK